MGDIADWVNDDMQDAYPNWCPLGTYRKPAPVTCDYCGTAGLEWAFTGSCWVLMNDDDGEPHVCNRTASPDDFEDVS